MLQTGEWYFAHPSTWEDPYEVRVKNNLSNALFAQCWCRKGVSDAMWRIYSQDKLGIRIRINKDRLRDALFEATQHRNIGFRISKIRYINELEYATITAQNRLELERRVTFIRASAHLYLKRPAFEHEAETRVVVADLSQAIDFNPKSFKIKLDTRKLIETVLVDPRAPDEYVEAYKYYLKDKLKFPGSVRKSSLYKSDETREA